MVPATTLSPGAESVSDRVHRTQEGIRMVVCLRTVDVPVQEREGWIAENRGVRKSHGILAELVLEYPHCWNDEGPA
jgi:hypothetical protein